jgi:hypothetical protein
VSEAKWIEVKRLNYLNDLNALNDWNVWNGTFLVAVTSSVIPKCYGGNRNEETNIQCRALMNGSSTPREMIPFRGDLRRKARFHSRSMCQLEGPFDWRILSEPALKSVGREWIRALPADLPKSEDNVSCGGKGPAAMNWGRQ